MGTLFHFLFLRASPKNHVYRYDPTRNWWSSKVFWNIALVCAFHLLLLPGPQNSPPIRHLCRFSDHNDAKLDPPTLPSSFSLFLSLTLPASPALSSLSDSDSLSISHALSHRLTWGANMERQALSFSKPNIFWTQLGRCFHSRDEQFAPISNTSCLNPSPLSFLLNNHLFLTILLFFMKRTLF